MAAGKGYGSECNAIKELIATASGLSDEESAHCEQAIEHLQWALDKREQSESTRAQVYMVFSWPLLINNGYLDLLEQRRPEALLIFAFYGAMLHHCRHLWLIGPAGEHIVSLITNYLGPEWQPWLDWPNEVIRSDMRSDGFNTEPFS